MGCHFSSEDRLFFFLLFSLFHGHELDFLGGIGSKAFFSLFFVVYILVSPEQTVIGGVYMVNVLRPQNEEGRRQYSCFQIYDVKLAW